MGGKAYTEQDEKIIKSLYGTVSSKVIASRLGREITADAILWKAHRMGLRMTVDQKKKLTREYREYYHDHQKEKRKRKFNGYGIDVVVGNALLEKKKGKPKKIHTFSTVWEDICECIGLDPEEKTTRRHSVAFGRHVFFYVMKDLYGSRFSLKELGGFFGNRDHTTVIHGIQKIRDGIKVGDPDFLRDWMLYLSKTNIYK